MKEPKPEDFPHIITDHAPPIRPIYSNPESVVQTGHPPYTRINILREGDFYAYHIYGETHATPALQAYDVTPEALRDVIRGLDPVSVNNVTAYIREKLSDPRFEELREVLLPAQVVPSKTAGSE